MMAVQITEHEVEPRLFVVTIAVDAAGPRSDLLAMASVLHRRGVEVVEAELAREAHERRVFSATFRATPRAAATVLRSFENLVDVVDAALFEALDARSSTHPRSVTHV